MGFRGILTTAFAIVASAAFALPPCFSALNLAESREAFRAHWRELELDFDPPSHVAEFHVNVLMPLFGPELYRRIQVEGRPRGNPNDMTVLSLPGNIRLLFGGIASGSMHVEERPLPNGESGHIVELTLPVRSRLYENPEAVESIFRALRAWTANDEVLRARIPTDAAAWIAQRRGQILGHDQHIRPSETWQLLPGTTQWSALTAGAQVLHPQDGWVEFESYSADGRVRFRRGPRHFDRMEPAHTAVALRNTPAASALLRERANDFAPLSSTALLVLADFFPTARARPWNARFPEGNLGERAKALRAAIVGNGIRHLAPAESLAERRAFLDAALEVYEKEGVDLVRVALGAVSEPREHEQDVIAFPALGLNLRRGRASSPYVNEVRGVGPDVYETHSTQLFRHGIAALAEGLPPGDPLLARLERKIEREASVGREVDHVLTNYYTEGHPISDGGTDTFTELLKRVQRDHDTEAAQRLARFARAQLAARGVDLSNHNLVLHAPGSDRIDPRNRAFHLAQAFAAQTGIPFADNAFTLGDDWRPQTTLRSVAERLLNASQKFTAANARLVRGKTIVLVEDANTSGVGLARLRALLYAAGANRVTVVAFAQTVSPDSSPLPGVRSYPPEAFP